MEKNPEPSWFYKAIDLKFLKFVIEDDILSS